MACQRDLSSTAPILCFALAAVLSGCGWVADLGRFEKVDAPLDAGQQLPDGDAGEPDAPTPDGGQPPDTDEPDDDPGRASCGDGVTFCAYLTEFFLHESDRLEVNLVSAAPEGVRPLLRARAIFNPMGSPNLRFALPNAIVGNVHAQVWVDFNDNGVYDDPSADHTWHIEPVSQADMPNRHLSFERGVLEFRHDGSFDRLVHPPDGLGTSLWARVFNADQYRGNWLELRLIERRQQRTVGLYRHLIVQDFISLKIDDIADATLRYDVALYIDTTDSGRRDPEDPAWLVTDQLIVDDEPVDFELDAEGDGDAADLPFPHPDPL